MSLQRSSIGVLCAGDKSREKMRIRKEAEHEQTKHQNDGGN